MVPTRVHTSEQLIALVTHRHQFSVPVRTDAEGARLMAFLESLQQKRYPELAHLSVDEFQELKRSTKEIVRFYIEDPIGLRRDAPMRERRARRMTIASMAAGGLVGLLGAPLIAPAGDLISAAEVLMRGLLCVGAGAVGGLVILEVLRLLNAFRISRLLDAASRRER